MRSSWIPLVIACASASTSAVAIAKPARAVVQLGELTVRFGGSPIARLHADGRTESVADGKPGPDAKLVPGPTLHADGTIALTKGGFTARVAPNGDVFVVSPPSAHEPDRRFGHIEGDTLSLAGGHDSSVRLVDGKLVSFYDGKPSDVLGVIDPPRLGRTALVLTAAFYMDLSVAQR